MKCIIGSNSFIGRHIATEFPHAQKVTREQLDLLDSEACKKYFENKNFDLIIHCAAVGGSRLKNDDDSVYNDNIHIFHNVYNNANFKHMIWFSSGAADCADTPYGRAKHDIEYVVRLDNRIHTLKIWGCFGPGEPSTRLLATAKREGVVSIPQDRLFDFVHVCDVVETVQKIVDSDFKLQPKFIHMVYHGKPLLLSEVVACAGFTYKIIDENIGKPYIGTPYLAPILKDRIIEYIAER